MISQSSQNRLVPRVSLSTSSLRWRPVFCRFLRSSWASGWSWWKAAWQPWETAGEISAKKRHRGCDWVSCTMYPWILGWFYFSFSESNRNSIPHIHESLPDSIKRGNWKSTILMMFPTIRIYSGIFQLSSQPPKILPEGNLTENPININVKLKFKSLKLPLAFCVRLSSVQNPLLFHYTGWLMRMFLMDCGHPHLFFCLVTNPQRNPQPAFTSCIMLYPLISPYFHG